MASDVYGALHTGSVSILVKDCKGIDDENVSGASLRVTVALFPHFSTNVHVSQR